MPLNSCQENLSLPSHLSASRNPRKIKPHATVSAEMGTRIQTLMWLPGSLFHGHSDFVTPLRLTDTIHASS
jgi:hypothetical protein